MILHTRRICVLAGASEQSVGQSSPAVVEVVAVIVAVGVKEVVVVVEVSI